MIKAKIKDISVYLPANKVGNTDMENLVNAASRILPPGSLHKLFGSENRHFAATDEQVSDLAVAAARPIVEKIGAENIDFLIFAAASADLIEPATANMVQHKLGLRCPAADVKNACNSVTSALLMASALIQSGMYRSVLIANGEKPSDTIPFHLTNKDHLVKHLAAFSLGDAGAALLVTASDDESGIVYQKFMTEGEHWQLCTIKGGGSMYPRDMEKTYFEGQTVELKQVLAQNGTAFFHQCATEAGWNPDDIQHFFTHQVSGSTNRLISDLTHLRPNVLEETFQHYGNTAAASIPLAMHRRLSRGEVKKGDKVAWLGLAAGVSASVQLMIW